MVQPGGLAEQATGQRGAVGHGHQTGARGQGAGCCLPGFTEAGLDQAQDEVARAVATGACLVAVGGGTALTRRLVCEAARLEHGAVTMLVEDGSQDSVFEDRARTAVLSGRTDLVGTRHD